MVRMESLPALAIGAYSSNVQIFEHTLAIDVPSRLDAIANSFVEHNNQNFQSIAEHVNNSMTSVYDYIDGTIYEDVLSFKAEVENGIGDFVGIGAGYSINQVNNVLFTGNTSYSENFSGQIVSFTNGNKHTYDIVYDSDDNVVSFKEKINISGTEYIESYTVTYTGNIPTITKE